MQNVKEILNKELEQCRVDIINRHVQAGQRATGTTANSLRVTTDDYNGKLYGAEYIGVLQTGRKAGKVPYDFKNILIKWARAKGITFGNQSELNRFAYFLAKRIRENGTLLYGKNKDIFTTPIKDMNDRLIKELSSFFVVEIKNSIYEKAK